VDDAVGGDEVRACDRGSVIHGDVAGIGPRHLELVLRTLYNSM
jgi:hypothetical protein